MFSRLFSNISRKQLEVGKFAFYLITPIATMFYVGIDTDKKFNVEGFWPDPATLNQIPKEKHLIQAELARMRAERIARRERLEKRAAELGLKLDEEEEESGESGESGGNVAENGENVA